MSSDEEDLDLNDESISQLDNNSEDGEVMEQEDLLDQPSTQGSPAPQQDILTKRNIHYQLHPDAIHCKFYDIVPIASAVHPNAIYSVATTRCFRWVLTGSDDGFIRKWDFFASMNGKTPLTQAHRHHLVDSVTNSGVLSSWWENEEQPEPIIKTEPGETTESSEDMATTQPSRPITTSSVTSSYATEPRLSPAFSMDMQSEALWSVQGMESGAIQLITVRHEEGKCHHVFRKHTAPVSVLRIVPDETGIISGSWDKNVLEWDLHTGNLIRHYSGHISQLATAHFQPIFTPFVTPSKSKDNKSTNDKSSQNEISSTANNESTMDTSMNEENDMDDDNASLLWDQKNVNIFLTASIDGQVLIWDRRMEKEASKVTIPNKTPPWTLSACWGTDGSKIYIGRRNGTVDEWDYTGQKLLQSFRMPANSGPVYHVTAMPNGKHIVCASNDNIRLWNTTIESNYTIRHNIDSSITKPSSVIPFVILPGHHGGMTSHVVVDPTCRYMITASGNRGWEGGSNNLCLFYDISPIM
ncbi:WD40-repeat-containing domain protein [Halteromyces radiatus]|uniref:WD40-repeat-containing domain protein n=1 Tax=Halteromyces radiatus TaxID=101107 RepID=UPI00222109DD|nr:WD40-repeat-containing domain protein [Halteromyces radiatus]KAI8086504.1 WD40-repeat-containing domain protein [Halteromyces radiatus]